MSKNNLTLANITSRIEAGRAQFLAWTALLLACLFLAGCSQAQATTENFHITIDADGKQFALQVPAGTTTQAALQQAGVTLNNLDKVEPASYAILSNDTIIKITRVREVFNVKQNIIPFESKRLNNESLPESTELLVQQGVNGQEQVTYRQVFENDKEVSNTIFKTEILVEPVPEIKMIGVQKPFTPVPLPGKLVYLTGGNAWLMETTTSNRRPVVTSGDLDGRIFALSPKGDWLLFTRAEKRTEGDAGSASGAAGAATPASTATASPNASGGSASSANAAATPGKINSLWAVDLTEEGSKPVNLKVDNVVNFAAWVPGKGLTITYSTVEPRSTEAGWQSNNDLQMLTFAPTGTVAKLEKILETNMGGVYGWWGTDFAWSPDGSMLAYARPDEVGLVDVEKKTQIPLSTILPYRTGENWAWVPEISWAPDHQVLFMVTHRTSAEFDNSQMSQSSPLFDLTGMPVETGPLISIVNEAGMFAYPVTSPMIGTGYRVAYLQSREPRQSDTRPYRLAVMDRDGSNRKMIFPAEDQQGIKPQRVAWSPATFDNGHLWLAVNYLGNLWLVDSETGESQQVTGDGSISLVDWK